MLDKKILFQIEIMQISYRKILFLVLPVILIILAQSCAWNSEEVLYPESKPCDTLDVKYSTHIAPLLQLKCNACHNSVNSTNDVTTDNYQDLLTVVNSGQFWSSVNHESGFDPMPKNQAKMDDCRLSIIGKWIADGSPNN